MSNNTLRISWVCCIAAFTSACSVNPVVSWTPPTRTGQPATNLDYALAYAQNVQDAYKSEISRQAAMSSNLANGLVATGALALAFAVGKAHRDALAGVALLGGTGYALGNMNLNKQRLLVLQAGHEAIGCARKAVIPLRMTDPERGVIEKALADLDAASPLLDVSAARERVAFEAYKKSGGSLASDEAARASAAIQVATDVTAAVAGASGSGRVLVTQSRQAGDNLIAAVDKIDQAITRANLDSLPDLTSVSKVIAGLAGFAAQIAPGTGVEKIVSAGLAARNESLKSGKSGAGDASDALTAATLELEKNTAAVQTQLRIVQSYLLAYQPGNAALEALKECGVTDAYFPLKASVEKLVFATASDATKSFALTGGAKPYVVELADSQIAGLSVKGPAPFETRVVVSVSKDVVKSQSASILVMDSSNPMKTLHIPITIGEQTASVATPDVTTNKASPKPATVQDIATVLNAGFSFMIEKTQITLGTKAKVVDDTLTVGVSCAPPPAARFPQGPLRDKLLATVAPDGGFTPLAAKVKIEPSAKCVSDK